MHQTTNPIMKQKPLRQLAAFTSSSTVLLLLAAVTGVILGLGLDQVFLLHIGHDQAWCLYAADLVLHGVQLNGPELVETNPPFIIWFSCLPVLLGQLLHLGILDGFRIFFDGIVIASILWTTLLVRRFYRLTAFTLGLFILAESIVNLWLIRRDSLGQREHLLVLLILPYLVLAAARSGIGTAGEIHAARGNRAIGSQAPGRQARPDIGWLQSVCIGLVAAVAVCLKPQHILVIVFSELLVLAASRTLRAVLHPAVWTFAAGIAAYALCVLAFGQTYLHNVAPLMRIAYWGFNRPYPVLFHHHLQVFAGLPLCWIIFLVLRHRMRLTALAAVFGVAAVGSTLAYAQQHKGWSYQLIPAGLFTVLFISTTVIGVVEEWLQSATSLQLANPGRPQGEARGWAQVPASTLVLILAVSCLGSAALGWRFEHRAEYFKEKKIEAANFFKPYPEGTAVGYLSTEPWEMPGVIEQHKVLGQRFVHLWLLPAIILGQDPDGNELHHPLTAPQIEELSSYQRKASADDLAHWKPAIVVVDQCGPGLCDALKREHYGSVLGWFLLNPDFEREWRHYQRVRVDGDLQAFRRTD